MNVFGDSVGENKDVGGGGRTGESQLEEWNDLEMKVKGLMTNIWNVNSHPSQVKMMVPEVLTGTSQGSLHLLWLWA